MMIRIKVNEISISSMSDNSGVFIGNNFEPNWSAFTKSNTNISGNKNNDSINIIFDKDGFDFTISEENNAQEISITKKKNKAMSDKAKDNKPSDSMSESEDKKEEKSKKSKSTKSKSEKSKKSNNKK